MSDRLGFVSGTNLQNVAGPTGDAVLLSQDVVRRNDMMVVMAASPAAPSPDTRLSKTEMKMLERVIGRIQDTVAKPRAGQTLKMTPQVRQKLEQTKARSGKIGYHNNALEALVLLRNAGNDLMPFCRARDQKTLLNLMRRAPQLTPNGAKGRPHLYAMGRRPRSYKMGANVRYTPIFLKNQAADNAEKLATPTPELVVKKDAKNQVVPLLHGRRKKLTNAYESLKNPNVVPLARDLVAVMEGPTRSDDYRATAPKPVIQKLTNG
ncbi:MAG: hypothetical protein EOM37_01015 [Proteobacteria bacterium]|nr:hypothetical protein [Pseudomonadota bacterium]